MGFHILSIGYHTKFIDTAHLHILLHKNTLFIEVGIK